VANAYLESKLIVELDRSALVLDGRILFALFIPIVDLYAWPLDNASLTLGQAVLRERTAKKTLPQKSMVPRGCKKSLDAHIPRNFFSAGPM
ncbi:MAG: hypothetical protein ACKPKO_22675, partial [Candidatus Fonsibacter sp.]